MFNDIIENRIEILENTKNFQKEYHIRDYNTNAIDIQKGDEKNNLYYSNYYILALSKDKNKWNIFPKTNNEKEYKITHEELDNFKNIVNEYHENGLDFFDGYL
jgi:hypothetical protein